ncbi:MAG: methyltransferase domain-containing protein [Magnetococcales bacterium]|nr:methyltransferase domain-containing protein [Magnetococcales bacterium]
MGRLAFWNDRHSRSGSIPPPARVVIENQHLLPPKGQGLDLACGLGANALFLAQHGIETLAWDFSDVAIDRLKEMSQRQSLPLTAEVRDVVSFPPWSDGFDCVVVSRFLERSLAGPIMASLRPGGILMYQTFLRDKSPGIGPDDPAYLLNPNELLTMFSRLRLLAYREEGQVGNRALGWRNEAMLVGMRVD